MAAHPDFDGGSPLELPCPSCGLVLPTRILADSVTLITVGTCPAHGTVELVRVSIAEPTPARSLADNVYPTEPQLAHPAGSARSDDDLVSIAYRPGAACGFRLGRRSACSLPTGHAGQHRD